MLTIYRASAGAGKTHTLTGEYLTLLFAHPAAYRRILAVTFTNKATDEMKSRIIEELYRLASGKKSGYIGMLCRTYTWTEPQLRQKAKETLTTILHDYSAFNISTIDRFFQQTVRAFTREIGLQGGYGIEMDQELVLTEAIDRLLTDLDKAENKALLGWLLRFAEEKIEDGGEWNLRRDIMALSREVFKESFKQLSEQVSDDVGDKDTLEQYKKDLYSIIHAVEDEAKRLGEKGMALLNEHGLHPSDFKGGSRSPMFILEKLAAGEMKEPTATFIGLVDNVDGFYTKTTEPEKSISIIRLFDNGLNDCVKAIVTLFSSLTDYNTAKEIVRYYYTLGILNDVSQQITAYREEKNIMLIADTTELLSKIIDGSDAPFIYEKTGTTVDHYMIDEFQDTSGMQWHNFRPLLKESLSHKKANLIVGDVKQSIYRFRNSDWKLLDEQVRHDFLPGMVKEETLKENWRSSHHIVYFNNTLFTTAPELLQSIYNEALDSSSLSTADEREAFFTKIVSAYNKSYQLVAPPFEEKAGHVRIDFLSQDDDERSWKEEAMDRLPLTLERLQDNGYELKDIAILVRTNQEGALVAETLLEYKEEHISSPYRYDIVSDEALFVSSSSAVRFIVSLLRYLKNPEDKTQEQMVRFSYYALSGRIELEDTAFPTEVQEEIDSFTRLSLYEMTEGIYRLFSDTFPEKEQAFVQAFLDMVAEFVQRETTDLGRFLKWWDETGHKKAIATPDGQNAVRILTVHKAKGLGIKVIIIPFADWELDHRPTKPVILWCQPQVKPFDRLHLVPVRYGKGLANTHFAKDYFNEKLYAYIDNLNTLYVAFTRAKEELIVFSPRPKKFNKSTGEVEKIDSVSTLLWSSLSTSVSETRDGEPLLELPPLFDKEEGVFEIGDWWQPEKKAKETNIEEVMIERLTSVSPDERLQLRLYGKGFFFDDQRRKHGALMHDILSRISTSEDISASVDSYRLTGLIDEAEASELKIKLEQLLNKPDVYPWYHAPTRVLNEVDILTHKGRQRRPDRVMIFGDKAIVVDYKFGEQKDKRYHKQVREYLCLIRDMGYTEVVGYLWYVELDVIEEVNI